MDRRSLVCRSQYETVKAGRSQGIPFGPVLENTAITSDENSVTLGLKMANPFEIGRMAPVRQPVHFLAMHCRMPNVTNESVQRRRKYGSGTIVEENVHTAARRPIWASNCMARWIAAGGTSYIRAAVARLS